MPVREHADRASLVGLAISDLGGAAELLCRGGTGDPRQLRCSQRAAEQARVIVPLHDDQHVALQILVGDVPRVLGRVAAPTNAQTLALSERVVHEAAMLADFAA